ncbi:MAG: 3'-5' exonuclease [Spirochaetota bacterium]
MILWDRLKKRLRPLYDIKEDDLQPFLREYLHSFDSEDVEKPIEEIQFTVFDSETTGLESKKGHRIVSLSAVRLINGRIDLSDVFHELINPNRDIPSTSIIIHEIVPDMVSSQPSIEEVLPRFIKFIGSSVLVAHHGWLDMGFLNNEMMRLYGFPIRNILLDTVILDKTIQFKKFPFAEETPYKNSSTLKDVATRYNVCIEELHSSFWDATITAQIFQQLLKTVQQDGIVKLKHLLKYVNYKNKFN